MYNYKSLYTTKKDPTSDQKNTIISNVINMNLLPVSYVFLDSDLCLSYYQSRNSDAQF